MLPPASSAKERQQEAVRARELALAELHAATLLASREETVRLTNELEMMQRQSERQEQQIVHLWPGRSWLSAAVWQEAPSLLSPPVLEHTR